MRGCSESAAERVFIITLLLITILAPRLTVGGLDHFARAREELGVELVPLAAVLQHERAPVRAVRERVRARRRHPHAVALPLERRRVGRHALELLDDDLGRPLDFQEPLVARAAQVRERRRRLGEALHVRRALLAPEAGPVARELVARAQAAPAGEDARAVRRSGEDAQERRLDRVAERVVAAAGGWLLLVLLLRGQRGSVESRSGQRLVERRSSRGAEAARAGRAAGHGGPLPRSEGAAASSSSSAVPVGRCVWCWGAGAAELLAATAAMHNSALQRAAARRRDGAVSPSAARPCSRSTRHPSTSLPQPRIS